MSVEPLRLRAVLVNWNGGDLLQRAVRSVLAASWSGPVDVVVVDNASTDGSLASIEGLPAVHVVHRSHNEGFGANNHGFADLLGGTAPAGLERPDVVLLLNPDARLEPDALVRLSDALDPAAGVGAAAPRIVFDRAFVELEVEAGDVTIESVVVDGRDVTTSCHGVAGAYRLPGTEAPVWRCGEATGLRVPVVDGDESIVVRTGPRSDGTIAATPVTGAQTLTLAQDVFERHAIVQNAGSRLGPRGTGESRGFTARLADERSAPVAPAWCGAAVLFSADYLADVGGFEPTYFLYYEDIDLSVRGLGRGWTTAHVPDAIVEHRHSDRATQGTERVEVLQHRNRLVMLVRNAPIPQVISAFAAAAATPVSLLVSSVRSGDGAARRRLASWRIRSLVNAVRMVPAAVSGRRRLGRERSRSTAEVWKLATGE